MEILRILALYTVLKNLMTKNNQLWAIIYGRFVTTRGVTEQPYFHSLTPHVCINRLQNQRLSLKGEIFQDLHPKSDPGFPLKI